MEDILIGMSIACSPIGFILYADHRRRDNQRLHVSRNFFDLSSSLYVWFDRVCMAPGSRVLLWFAVLYVVIWITRVIMGVVPNLLTRWLGASPDFRAYIGSTLNYGVGMAAYVLLPALALQKVLGIDPRSALFPKYKGWRERFALWLPAHSNYPDFVLRRRGESGLADHRRLDLADPGDRCVVSSRLGGIAGKCRGCHWRGDRLSWLSSNRAEKCLGTMVRIRRMTVIFGLFHLPAYIEGGIQSATLTLAILLASLFGLLFGLTISTPVRFGCLCAALHVEFCGERPSQFKR